MRTISYAIVLTILTYFAVISVFDSISREGKIIKEELKQKELGVVSVSYKLSDSGYIDEVTLKDNSGTTVVNGRDYTINFEYDRLGDTPRYSFNEKNKLLTIYDSKYPSDKYK